MTVDGSRWRKRLVHRALLATATLTMAIAASSCSASDGAPASATLPVTMTSLTPTTTTADASTATPTAIPTAADGGLLAVSTQSLSVGDCIELGMFPGQAYQVSCETSHDGEVVGRVELTGGDFPGKEALQRQSNAACTRFLSASVKRRLPGGELLAESDVPSFDEWNGGSRAGVCVVSRGYHGVPIVGHL